DYSGPITELLGLSDSTARFKRLEAAIGTKLVFEPRRRGDVEFIFAPAQPSTERLLRPQLRFHYAGDIPTYATSDAFEPDVRANEELDGLMFPDMPWMLGGELADAVRNATREAWPSGGPQRGRLFAFGFDAFRLAPALRQRGLWRRGGERRPAQTAAHHTRRGSAAAAACGPRAPAGAIRRHRGARSARRRTAHRVDPPRVRGLSAAQPKLSVNP